MDGNSSTSSARSTGCRARHVAYVNAVAAMLVSTGAMAQETSAGAVSPPMEAIAGVPTETVFVLVALASLVLIGLTVVWLGRIRSLERQVADLTAFSTLAASIRRHRRWGSGSSTTPAWSI